MAGGRVAFGSFRAGLVELGARVQGVQMTGTSSCSGGVLKLVPGWRVVVMLHFVDARRRLASVTLTEREWNVYRDISLGYRAKLFWTKNAGNSAIKRESRF